MKVLITGCHSQVGLELRNCIPPAGMDIVGLNRRELDICNPTNIAHALDVTNPDIVINTAAFTAVDRAETEREQAYAANTIGARNLAHCCTQRNIALIHLSTDFVFDGLKQTPYIEQDPTFPLNVYGASKRSGEEAIQENCPRHLIMRTSWVYSPYKSNFMKTMLRLAADNQVLRVVDDQVGAPTAAADIAATLLIMCTSALQPGFSGWGTYHYTARGQTTWYGFARALLDLHEHRTGTPFTLYPIQTGEYPAAADRPGNSRLDCCRIEREFGLERQPWHIAVARDLDRMIASATQSSDEKKYA